jgi:hypothetical protein
VKKSLMPPAESVAVLAERDPALYSKITELLEAGHSPGGVAALTNTNIQTIRARREVCSGAIHAAIRRMGYDLVEASQKAASRLADEIDQVPISKLPQALSVLLDKVALISGLPTSRVEVGHAKPLDREALLRMYDALVAKRADAIEITRGNGSS